MRIRANPSVEVAQSDSRGREKGDRVKAGATVIAAADRPDLWRAFCRAHPVLARLDELRHRKDGFVFLELTPADQAEDPPQSSSNATAST